MITLSQLDHSNLYINARVSQFSPLLSATSSPDRAIAYASFSRAIKMENSGGRFFEKKKFAERRAERAVRQSDTGCSLGSGSPLPLRGNRVFAVVQKLLPAICPRGWKTSREPSFARAARNFFNIRIRPGLVAGSFTPLSLSLSLSLFVSLFRVSPRRNFRRR